jgi:hypothetical protein
MPTDQPSGSDPGDTPVFPAPTRSRTNLANPGPGTYVGSPGTAVPRRSSAEREQLRFQPNCIQPQPEVPRQGRRTDAAVTPGPERDWAAGVAHGLAISETRRRNPWRIVAGVIGMIAVSLLCVLLWPIIRKATENSTRDSPAYNPSTVVVASPSRRRGELPVDPDAALTTALDRLSTALEGVPGRSSEEILRQLSTHRQGCRMVWTGDVPSLVFGGEPLRPNSLAYTLEDCAEAVSRLH